jgi:hypothetical protein
MLSFSSLHSKHVLHIKTVCVTDDLSRQVLKCSSVQPLATCLYYTNGCFTACVQLLRMFIHTAICEQYTYLKSTNGSTLEAKICLEILCDLTNKALERQFPDKQLSGFLVSSNFSKSHSTWPTKNMKVLSTVDNAAILNLKALIYKPYKYGWPIRAHQVQISYNSNKLKTQAQLCNNLTQFNMTKVILIWALQTMKISQKNIPSLHNKIQPVHHWYKRKIPECNITNPACQLFSWALKSLFIIMHAKIVNLSPICSNISWLKIMESRLTWGLETDHNQFFCAL